MRELVVAGALALAGPEGLDADDLAEADRQAAVQVAYLDRFERDVRERTPAELAEPTTVTIVSPAPMTVSQFTARAELYGNSAWTTALSATRKAVIRGGRYKEEIRLHSKTGPHDECTTCSTATAAGWQPIGTLPEIGDSECLGNCDCYFLFREGPGSPPLHIGQYHHARRRKVA